MFTKTKSRVLQIRTRVGVSSISKCVENLIRAYDNVLRVRPFARFPRVYLNNLTDGSKFEVIGGKKKNE